MKKNLYISLAILFVSSFWGKWDEAFAQTGTTAYEFMNLPVSAHSAAVGGNNVSMIEDDVTLMFSNPALLSNVSNKTLNFNFMTYMAGTNKMSVSYAMQAGERGTWAVGGQLLSYGSMTETTAAYEELGSFNANDIALQGGYTYLLSDEWSGGVQGKVLMSNYGEFKSMGLCVDLGLNYYDEAHGFSFGVVAQNLGGQVKTLHEVREKMPFNLAMGISKEFANAPIRISVTLQDLTHWKSSYYGSSDGNEISGSKRFWNHVSLGAEVFPTAQTWIGLGYNFRRGNEMKVADSSHWAGFSIGGGIGIKKFKVGVSYAKYHISSSSLIVNAAYSL